MFVVDTNILLYAADKQAKEHTVCFEFLEGCRRQPVWHLTWGILYEFLRVATHPRVFEKPWEPSLAWDFINSILVSPGLGILRETERHADIAQDVFQQTPALFGNLVFDGHTAILMKEHGIERIYTRDADFHRFSFVEAIDPLAK